MSQESISAPRPLPRIKDLEAYVPGRSIAEIQREFGLARVIKLASNENPLGMSPLAADAICRFAQYAFRYPQGGNPRLAGALAALHNVDSAQIAIGNGSDEIIDLLVRTLCESGVDNMACFDPCFSIYPIQARIAGVELRRQPLEKDFSFDFDGLLSRVDQNTRLVFVTAPDNPSGYCPAAEQIADLAEKLAQKSPRALLVVDEAYVDFADDEKAHSLLSGGITPANTAFLRTFSKSYGLAGLRVGYAVLPAEIADGFWRARLPFSVNILAEEAAMAAIKDSAFRQATMKTVKEGRSFLAKGLEKLGCQVWKSSANFLMFRLPDPAIEGQTCFEALLRQGIIIRPLNSYGLPGHLRVSVGNLEENRAFLEAMEVFMRAGTGTSCCL